jgi:predicted phage-related endonuclease
MRRRQVVDRATAIAAGNVGASQLGAVLGCDPWTTPLRLFRRLTGLDPEPVQSEAMSIGVALEGPVVGLLRPRLLEPIRRNRLTFLHPSLPLFATPDGFVGYGRTLEVKVVGVYSARDWDDDPPCSTRLQVQGQLMVTGRESGYVAALIGTEVRLWTVYADPEVQRTITDAVTAFVSGLVAGVPPDPLTYGERWADVLAQLSRADRVEAWAGPDAQTAGLRLLAIRADVNRLEDEANGIRLELAGAMLRAGATELIGSGWTGTVQDTKGGTTIVVRAGKD